MFCRAVDVFSGRAEGVSLSGVSPPQDVVPTELPTVPPPPPSCGEKYPPKERSDNQQEVFFGPPSGGGRSYLALKASDEVLGYFRSR